MRPSGARFPACNILVNHFQKGASNEKTRGSNNGHTGHPRSIGMTADGGFHSRPIDPPRACHLVIYVFFFCFFFLGGGVKLLFINLCIYCYFLGGGGGTWGTRPGPPWPVFFLVGPGPAPTQTPAPRDLLRRVGSSSGPSARWWWRTAVSWEAAGGEICALLFFLACVCVCCTRTKLYSKDESPPSGVQVCVFSSSHFVPPPWFFGVGVWVGGKRCFVFVGVKCFLWLEEVCLNFLLLGGSSGHWAVFNSILGVARCN